MKYFILFCTTLWASISYAQEKSGFEIGVSGSWQSENLNWSIAGNSAGQNPNIYSELKWKNVQGARFDASIKYLFIERYYIASTYSYSSIVSGTVTDTDYANDDRQNPTFYAFIDADKGSIHRLEVTAGYLLYDRDKFTLAAGAGYRNDTQHMFLLDHQNEQTGQMNLRSTYDVSWKGFLVTAQAVTDIGFASLEGQLNYSQLQYSAEADWNLIDAFQHPVSFRHYAKGYALEANLKVKRNISPALSVYVSGSYQYAGTGKGTDELYMASGEVLGTQFNGADRYNKTAGLGLSFRF